jgi:hypothetical protein
LDTSDKTLEGKPNAAYGQWVNTSKAVIGVNAFDPGIGINAVGAKSPNKSEWGFGPRGNEQDECDGDSQWAEGVQCNECHENECANKVHSKPYALPFKSTEKFDELGELPEGEDTVK